MRQLRTAIGRGAARLGALAIALVVAAAALAPAPARAQAVFEDNFDGSALGAHWITPPASHWEYDVSGGMLNVHRVLFPSHPKSPSNSAGISALISPSFGGDFYASMRILWEPDTPLSVRLGLFGTTTIASVQYNSSFIVFENAPGPGQTAPSPGAGVHDLAIQRIGPQLRFFLDGSLLGALPDTSMEAISRVGLNFGSSFPIPPGGPAHIDFVRIVPTPGVLMVSGVAMGLIGRRKR